MTSSSGGVSTVRSAHGEPGEGAGDDSVDGILVDVEHRLARVVADDVPELGHVALVDRCGRSAGRSACRAGCARTSSSSAPS